MPFVLSRVPVIPVERTVAPGGVPITVRPLQPVAWARLVPWKVDEVLPPIHFPVVFDTGNNGTVLMSETLFRAVSGLNPAVLIEHHTAAVNGVVLRGYRFNLDLLRLRDGTATNRVASRLQTDRGVFVIPTDLEHRFPRIPIIGVRCLTANRLTFSLNGDRRMYSLWRPPIR